MRKQSEGTRKLKPKLLLENISATYTAGAEPLPVIDALSLHVAPGEFVSLLGPSGSGKSTLLKIAAGLIRPERGRVFLDGREVTGRPARVGYMPQQALLFPWKTLLHNAALPLLAAGVPREAAYSRVMEMLPVFGLERFAHYYPNQLSGGMRQRAALLRTILVESGLLLLDEPFAALDALTRDKMRDWLLAIWEQFKRSVLFVTHSIDEAIYLSDLVCMISARPGRIILDQPITLPRPRTRQITNEPLFLEYKQKLFASLEE